MSVQQILSRPGSGTISGNYGPGLDRQAGQLLDSGSDKKPGRTGPDNPEQPGRYDPQL